MQAQLTVTPLVIQLWYQLLVLILIRLVVPFLSTILKSSLQLLDVASNPPSLRTAVLLIITRHGPEHQW